MELLLRKQECPGCGRAVPIWSDVCLRCGRVLHPPRRLRTAGVLYLVLGLALTLPVTYLIVWVARTIARSDDPGATTRFSGGAWEAALTFGVLGFVLGIGLLGIAMGVWQLRHGRRNLRLVRVAIVFYVVFWVGSMLVIELL